MSNIYIYVYTVYTYVIIITYSNKNATFASRFFGGKKRSHHQTPNRSTSTPPSKSVGSTNHTRHQQKSGVNMPSIQTSWQIMIRNIQKLRKSLQHLPATHVNIPNLIPFTNFASIYIMKQPLGSSTVKATG